VQGGREDLLTGSSVIPGFNPKTADKHDTRHQELLQFFHYRNVFRNPDEIPIVEFSLKFDVLNDARCVSRFNWWDGISLALCGW
jgi:hypothetical protein